MTINQNYNITILGHHFCILLYYRNVIISQGKSIRIPAQTVFVYIYSMCIEIFKHPIYRCYPAIMQICQYWDTPGLSQNLPIFSCESSGITRFLRNIPISLKNKLINSSRESYRERNKSFFLPSSNLFSTIN